MLGQDYRRGFILGMLASLLTIANFFAIAYFTDCPTVCIWVLIVVPFAINLLSFCPSDYLNWIYRRVVFWICFALFLTFSINIFGALFVIQEDNILKLIAQTGFETDILTLSARRIVYCTISHVLGTVASIIVVAIRKSKARKKYLKVMQQKQSALKQKNLQKSNRKQDDKNQKN